MDRQPIHGQALANWYLDCTACYLSENNALPMYGVVHWGIPASLGGLRKFTFFYLRKFTIGGKSISLYDLENDIVRPMGEERIQ